MEITINNTILRLVEGDITDLDVDAIVNAANRYLQLGSGVAGAIRTKGGPSIQRECDQIGGIPVGDAAITGGGNLKARHVIHAVGPHGGDRDADEKLVGATRASLALADKHGLKSIAFPAISTGVFGYPIDKCAHFMLQTAIGYLVDNPTTSLELVVFCLYGQAAFDVFERELKSR
ncbi:MAG: macro domain-containing protein [Anaerolineae bacterium]|nr:macro domain-containing protein [Anaerolineae bacterium]